MRFAFLQMYQWEAIICPAANDEQAQFFLKTEKKVKVQVIAVQSLALSHKKKGECKKQK